MRVQALVSLVAVASRQTAAEESTEDLACLQAEPFAIKQGCEQILDVLLVNLLPRCDVGTNASLFDHI